MPKKKPYAAPTMDVVKLEHQVHLLDGSNEIPAKYVKVANLIKG